MLIAQITDVHIGFEPGNPEEPNRRRFAAVMRCLLAAPCPPTALVVSGDLTERGDAESFAWLAKEVVGCPFPVLPMVGNHDTREGLLRAFPDTPTEGGFIHYAVDLDGLRLVLLDTLELGRHGGAFCAARRDWLAAELAKAPDTPTLIFMHHPPVESGIAWMDPAPDEPWLARFAEAVAGHEQIVAIHCGHLHRPLTTRFAGIPLSVCAPVAPAVALDLRDVDPDHPDGRDLIAAEPPGYALHRWDGARLASHFQPAGNFDVLARFDEMTVPMIRGMLGERGKP